MRRQLLHSIKKPMKRLVSHKVPPKNSELKNNLPSANILFSAFLITFVQENNIIKRCEVVLRDITNFVCKQTFAVRFPAKEFCMR